MLGHEIAIHRQHGACSARRLISAMTVIGGGCREISAPWFVLDAMYHSGPGLELPAATVRDTLRDAEVLFQAVPDCDSAISRGREPSDRREPDSES
jgi:hypothetical protein